MTIVRDKLQAALKAHERAAPHLVREALEHLDALEADARRWRAFRKLVEALASFPMADSANPCGSEIDAAAMPPTTV